MTFFPFSYSFSFSFCFFFGGENCGQLASWLAGWVAATKLLQNYVGKPEANEKKKVEMQTDLSFCRSKAAVKSDASKPARKENVPI